MLVQGDPSECTDEGRDSSLSSYKAEQLGTLAVGIGSHYFLFQNLSSFCRIIPDRQWLTASLLRGSMVKHIYHSKHD